MEKEPFERKLILLPIEQSCGSCSGFLKVGSRSIKFVAIQFSSVFESDPVNPDPQTLANTNAGADVEIKLIVKVKGCL